jgi:tetratricopeptide (TPR) repeat protein
VRLVEQGSEQTSKLGPKHLALLVYLSHERRPMHPTEVTELLGRAQEEDKEIAALRRAVGWLSDNVPGVNIRMSADTIDAIDGVWVDSAEVDAAIERGDPGPVERLYVGEFLEGFESGAAAFDEWATKERGRVKRAWNHAMLAASRRAEQEEDWDAAAQWWQMLVARAPMRPEAVASLLRAFMKGGQEDKATTAYFSYAALLAESGISQPADAVKEVIAEYPALQESTGVPVELPEPPVPEEPGGTTDEPEESDPHEADGDEVDARTSESEPEQEQAQEQEHTFESLSAALDAEFEAEFHIGPADEGAAAVDDQSGADEPEAEPEPEPEPEPVTPESMWPDEEFVDESEESGEELWQDVVDLASSDEIEFELSGEIPTEALEDELQSPASDPRVGLEGEDEVEEIFKADHDILAEDEVAEVVSDPEPPAAADLRETPYDQGAAFLDSQPEIPAEEESDEADSSGMIEAGAGAVGAGARALFSAPKLVGRKLGSLAGSTVSGSSTLSKLRSYWYVPVALGVAGLAFILGPKLLVTVGDLADDLPEVNTPALPKVTVRTPGFVETSVSRIGELLSGPILEESGQWVLVADFRLEVPAEVVPVESDAGLEESELSEGVSGEGVEQVDPTAVTDTMAVPEPGDSAGTPGDDTTRVRESVSAALVHLEPNAPGNSDGGTPGLDLMRPQRAISANLTAQDMIPPVRQDTTPPPAQQDTTPPVPQDTTPPVPRDAASVADQDTTEVSDSMQVADSAQSVGIDSIPVQPQDSVGAEPMATAVAEGSVQRPEAEPQERMSLAALAMAVEADLDQADFFHVVPRERALSALQGLEGQSADTLPVEAALRLADSEGWGAVISGTVRRSTEVDSLELQVLNAAGDTLYGVAAEISGPGEALETLAELTHAIRRRLGEPESEVEASPAVADFMSPRNAALNAYAEARAHLYVGRFTQAASAAREAVQRDANFVVAYWVLADAYAQGGARASGRSALEAAWNLSEQASERDSMRIHADRLAWDGQLSDAVVTYDELFQRYRDDVAALKSQALLQRTIGARGGGEGNLRVAYTIDPYDWPRLSRIARYLGYTGTLPDVDSLVASLQEPLVEEAPAEEPPSAEQESEG